LNNYIGDIWLVMMADINITGLNDLKVPKPYTLAYWIKPKKLKGEDLARPGALAEIAAMDSEIMTRQLDGNALQSYPVHQLASVLQVTLPRTEDLTKSKDFQAKVAAKNVAEKQKGKDKKKANVRKNRPESPQSRVDLPQYVSHLPTTISTASLMNSSAKIVGDEQIDYEPSSKRMRSLGDGPSADAARRVTSSSLSNSTNQSAPTSFGRIATNLKEVITEVFECFWNMEFEDQSCSDAFFSMITQQSCVSIGVPDYFEKFENLECGITLPVIRQKLDSGRYLNKETFIYDFRQMCTNITIYYGDGSLQAAKAIQLRAQFDAEWAKAEEKLKY